MMWHIPVKRQNLAALGLPQRQFALRIGVSVNTVNRWAMPAMVSSALG